MPSQVELFVWIVSLLIAVYYGIRYASSYWKRQGIEQVDPTFPVGNFGAFFRGRSPFMAICEDLYRVGRNKVIGIYILLQPMLLITDAELARNILVRDFGNFHDRQSVPVDEQRDPLNSHLFSLAGERWKHMRGRLTPIFTSSKLRGMLTSLEESGKVLQSYLKEHAEAGRVVKISDLLARYSIDNIASIVFGIRIDCISNPNEAFRVMGKKMFEPCFETNMRGLLNIVVPKANRFLKVNFVPGPVEKFFLDLVQSTAKHRDLSGVIRQDMMQLLLQLRNSGTVSQTDGQFASLSLKEIAAHAFGFFLAGFETSSTTMSFCLYELAKNPEIQRKVQQELDQILDKYDGQLSYEGTMEMRYLECCIDETLRKYPPIPVLNRECTIDYPVPGTDITIKKGTAIMIPVCALQRDPCHYPEPLKFKPERFLDQNLKDKPYAPFGEGPRACIGMRLGKILTKVGLARMFSKFNFELTERDQSELELNPKIIILTPQNGIRVRVSCR
ncbi:cytochrome P450 6d3-like [Uranotaenia lowii]|uniref:cytochrome P450 6d3-like n=1 Tax=Uranotaenia lowii TaxID=190385 RepID=UPI0024792648|nr:cytochrome P450 6d3-like [Uranotaenia lowii]